VVTRSSSDYQQVNGRIIKTNKHSYTCGLNHNFNRVLKNVFRSAANAANSGVFKQYYDGLRAKGLKDNLARLTLARSSIDFIKKAGGVKRHLYVDLRSLSIITDPTHVPAAFLRHFTELYGNLEPFIFPGRLAPVHDWPLDVPNCRATNYQERVEELRIARRDVEAIYQSTTRALTKNQIGECLRPHITLHKRISDNSLQLSPIKVDRLYFWSRLHPNWNPLLKPIEAAFL